MRGAWLWVVIAIGCGSDPDPGASTQPDGGTDAAQDGTLPDAGGDAGTSDADGGDTGGPTVAVSHSRELRAAWVATVYQLDYPSTAGGSASEQRAELIAILDRLAEIGMNAIVFQIRPESDALYASTLEPWSRFLSGTQGSDPGWDPLAELVAEAHARAIEVHAWINPYRGLTSTSVSAAPNHVTQTLSQHALTYNGMKWMDPGASAVREHVVAVVRDVVTRYDVDGIHFDDYFYPYPDAQNTPFPDGPSYSAYTANGGTLSLGDWRRNNVHLLVEGVAAAIAEVRPSVRFGVSPFGIYRPGMPPGIVGLDAYATIYCDPLEWVEQGWVDYVAPQLYWPTTQTAQAYGALLPWWAETTSGKAWVFAGNSLTKLGTDSAWTLDEIRQQILITRANRDSGALGNLFFRWQNLADDLLGIASMLEQELYAEPALPPPLIAAQQANPTPPLLSADGTQVSISHPAPSALRAFAVYAHVDDQWKLSRVLAASETSVTLGEGSWAISAIAHGDAESLGRLIELPATP